jgi:hypothetical protein
MSRDHLLSTLFVGGLPPCIMVGLLAGLIGGLKAGLIAGVGTGLSMWLVFAVLVMTNFDSRKQSSPQELRRFDLAVSAGLGLLVGLLMGAALGLAFGLPAVVAALGLPSGALIGLALSASWTLWTGHLYLWTKYRVALRPLRFLEDARARHLLRTVGAIYQFRHATLQDRLALRQLR